MLLAAAHESDYGPLTDLAQCPLSCRFQGISRRQVRAQPVHNLKLCEARGKNAAYIIPGYV